MLITFFISVHACKPNRKFASRAGERIVLLTAKAQRRQVSPSIPLSDFVSWWLRG
jgi:hypothetical protein